MLFTIILTKYTIMGLSFKPFRFESDGNVAAMLTVNKKKYYGMGNYYEEIAITQLYYSNLKILEYYNNSFSFYI